MNRNGDKDISYLNLQLNMDRMVHTKRIFFDVNVQNILLQPACINCGKCSILKC